MDLVKKIMRGSKYNKCAHCGRVIEKVEAFYFLNNAPTKRRLCSDCYPIKAFVDWDDDSEEPMEPLPGFEFYEIRGGRTIRLW